MNDKVKSIDELVHDTLSYAQHLDEAATAYTNARAREATDEERFNEGRYGRTVTGSIDALMNTLTQLRMRVNLQQEGRDSARARQLDRILGLSEEDTQLVDSMLDIAERVVAGERDYDEEADDERDEG